MLISYCKIKGLKEVLLSVFVKNFVFIKDVFFTVFVKKFVFIKKILIPKIKFKEYFFNEKRAQGSAELLLVLAGLIVIVLIIASIYKFYLNDLTREMNSNEMNNLKNSFNNISLKFKNV